MKVTKTLLYIKEAKCQGKNCHKSLKYNCGEFPTPTNQAPTTLEASTSHCGEFTWSKSGICVSFHEYCAESATLVAEGAIRIQISIAFWQALKEEYPSTFRNEGKGITNRGDSS